MSVENAVKLFTSIPKTHNCAQAVAGGCGESDLVADMAMCGGGKAPEGLCGALHAACIIASEEFRNDIIRDFQKVAGAITCRAIKSETGFPCPECVRLGAELAEKYRKK